MSKEAEAIEAARREYVAAMRSDDVKKEHEALMALIREVQKAKGK